MLLSKRSVVGLAAITSILAGCGTTTVVQGSPAGGSNSDAGATPGAARALSFAKPVAYANADDGGGVGAIRAVDIDGDGHTDLAVMSATFPVSVMRNAGDGTFEDAKSSGFRGSTMTTADVNGDGRGDVIVTDDVNDHERSVNDGVWVLYGAADGTLKTPTLVSHVSTDAHTRLMPADMNGDGAPEIVVCADSKVDVVSIDASGVGTVTNKLEINADSICAVGDIDANGRADLVTSALSDSFGVWLTDESGALPKLDILYSSGAPHNVLPTGVFAADLNGDERADVIVAFATKLLVRIANEDGTLAEPTIVTPKMDGVGPTSLAFADFDGDGHLDVVMSAGGQQGRTVAVLLGDGTGNLTQASVDFGIVGDSAGNVVAADFDGDGLPDIAVAFGTRAYVMRNASR